MHWQFIEGKLTTKNETEEKAMVALSPVKIVWQNLKNNLGTKNV